VVSNFGHTPAVKTFVNSTVTVWPVAQRTSKLNTPGAQLALVSTNGPLSMVINENSVYVARKAAVA
jgi:hypothetical protein